MTSSTDLAFLIDRKDGSGLVANPNVHTVRVNLRTINQGHSAFTAQVENSDNTYSNLYDAANPVHISYKGILLLNGYLDSIKAIVNQKEKWNFHSELRLAGKDLSSVLSDLQLDSMVYNRDTEVIDIIIDAFNQTGCPITVTEEYSSSVQGLSITDKYLLELVSILFENAQMEGYIDTTGKLLYWNISTPPSTGITLDNSNSLSIVPTEADGKDIRNDIFVLGANNQQYPSVYDSWTETSLAGWVLNTGTGLSLIHTDWPVMPPAGAYGVGGTSVERNPACGWIELQYNFPKTIQVGYHGQYTNLNFAMVFALSLLDTVYDMDIYLCTDDNNYFWAKFNASTFSELGFWQNVNMKLGESYTNRNGGSGATWNVEGNPSWANIKFVKWQVTFMYALYGVPTPDVLIIDHLGLNPARAQGYQSDTTSIARYGKRSLVKAGNSQSDIECQEIANYLVSTMAFPVSVVQVKTPLDTLIINGVFVGNPGSSIELNLSPHAVGLYKISEVVIDISPYNDIDSGFEATATLNLVRMYQVDPLTHDELYDSNGNPIPLGQHPDSLAAVIRPGTASLINRLGVKSDEQYNAQ